MEGDADLKKFRLSSLSSEICYVPDFISGELEGTLLQSIYNVPTAKWTNLSNRRLQNWGGTPHIKGMVEESLPRWLSEVCTKVSNLGLYGGKLANHVLINEYLPGQGIMPHTDGPLYHPTVAIVSLAGGCLLDFFKPQVDASESESKEDGCLHLENSAFDNMDSQVSSGYPPDGKRLGSVYLQPRSLVIFRESAYTECLHGIRETLFDVIDEKVANSDAAGLCKGIKLPRSDTRVSMTIRVVSRTIKASKIFGKSKF